MPPLETALCVEVVAYLDEDGDGHGAGDPVTLSCGLVPQYVTTAGDCDDTDRGVSPVAYERCGSGVDEDCDGAVDEAPEPNVILMDGFDSDCVLAHEPGVVTEVVATAWRGHILENIGDGLAVGDFTGDGSLDLLAVGNLNPEVGLDLYGDRRGGGYLVSGFRQRGLDAEAEHAAASVLLGGIDDAIAKASQVGDLNGDGYTDLFFGSIDWKHPITGEDGYGYSVMGPIPPGVVYIPEVGRRFDSHEESARLALSFTGPGDLDGDGLDDLVLGAPGKGNIPAAAVYILNGPAEHQVHEARTTLRGDDDVLGSTAAALGDVTGDGVSDFGVGGSQLSGGTRFGAVGYVVSSVPSGEVYVGDVGYRVGGFTDVVDTIVYLHAGGDVNGDGHLDVLVSVAQRSALALIHGPIPETGERHVYTDHDALLYESLNYDYLESVSAADRDADGYGELVIGEGSWTRAGSACDFGKQDGCNVGAVFTVAGPLGGHVDLMVEADRIEGPAQDGRLGQFVHAPDDLDGDGLADLVISKGSSTGSLYLLYGMR